MKYYFALIFSFVLINTSNAQTRADTVHLPTHIIKYSPLNVLDFNTPAIQFSYEKKLKNSAALQLELGYINKLFHNESYVRPLQGYRAKFELRRYEYWHTKSTNKSYIGGMLLIKQSFKSKEGLFNRYDGLYRERFSFQEVSTGGGLYFTMGKQFFFSNRMSLDIGFAAGLRYVNVQRSLNNIPDDAVLEREQLFDVLPGSYAFPSVFPVFKLGYCIP